MKRQILKYKLDRCLGVSLASMPKGWKFLHFGLDPNGDLCFWAEVDPEAEQSIVSLAPIFTGVFLLPGYKHLGTCIAYGYVLHLYRLPDGAR